MNRFGLGAALLAAMVGMAGDPAVRAQSAGDPTAPIRALDAALSRPAGSDLPSPAAIEAAVRQTFDLAALAAAVLGPEGARASHSQRQRFAAALLGRMALAIERRMRETGPGRLDFVRTRAIGPGDWQVATRVTVAGRPGRGIGWRVRAGPAGLRIVDMTQSGVSASARLRDSYAPVLRQHGIDHLIRLIEARNRANRE